MITNKEFNDDERFMAIALHEAELAFNEGEVPVGAVVVCENKIIARTHNLTQTLNDVTAHAEMQAITSAENFLGGKYLTNCSLYVTLEPCVMCAGAIGWAQFKNIIWGANDDKKGFSKISPKAIHPKTNIKSGVLKQECEDILLRFFKEKR